MLKKIQINCQQLFGFRAEFPAFGLAWENKNPAPNSIEKRLHDFIPQIDEHYLFDEETTKSILAALTFNRKSLIQGMHGTGKSTHIEQICARLGWPVIRINFDSQITRLDLVGKDVITIKDGQQITKFKKGIIPFALHNPVILILDEYDAMRPDVAFIIQRLLEENGKFALLEENEIITPHENFRLFATANTIGMGDDLGIYHGTNLINQAQMDRWNMVINLDYLAEKKEREILEKKLPFLNKGKDKNLAKLMVKLANLTRESFRNGDLSTLMTLRTLLIWGQNYEIFDDLTKSFKLSFYNKVTEDEKLVLDEFYQRVFGKNL